jgi:hypothetical protein
MNKDEALKGAIGAKYQKSPWDGKGTSMPPPEATVQEPVAWKWHQAPVKTSWGHDMVVADLAIDKDNTVSVYCERDQTAKVEAIFIPPAAPDLQAELDATNRQVEILSDALAESRREVDAMVALARADALANIDPSKFMSYQEAFEAGRLAEREQCAKVCDSLEEQCEKLLVPDEKWPTPSDCAHIIRARGNT